jgi:hypothetical protein
MNNTLRVCVLAAMEIAKDISRLIDVDTIYLEPAVVDYPRGHEILDAYPDAKRVEVPSHWKIHSLHGNEGSNEDWTKIKRQILVLGTKKSLASGRMKEARIL